MTEDDVKLAAATIRRRDEDLALLKRLETFSGRGLFQLFGERADGKEDHLLLHPDAEEGAAIQSLITNLVRARLIHSETLLATLGVDP